MVGGVIAAAGLTAAVLPTSGESDVDAVAVTAAPSGPRIDGDAFSLSRDAVRGAERADLVDAATPLAAAVGAVEQAVAEQVAAQEAAEKAAKEAAEKAAAEEAAAEAAAQKAAEKAAAKKAAAKKAKKAAEKKAASKSESSEKKSETTKSTKKTSSSSSAPKTEWQKFMAILNDTATWNKLAKCESGGNWKINTGNGYYGGLQFSLPTWKSNGGKGYPHQASKAEQIEVAKRLAKGAKGFGAWPACSKKLGLPR